MPVGITEKPGILRMDAMTQFKRKLTRLVRKEMCLSSRAEAEIFSFVNTHRSPGRIFRFLVNLYHFKILWTFPVIEQKTIIESTCKELSHNFDAAIYIRLINIIFESSLNERHGNAGIENFITFTKTKIKNESNFTIKAGLSLVLLKIVNKYPELVHITDIKELTPSLLFLKDNISYTSILNHLINLFGTHKIIPSVTDLLIKHPQRIDIFLTRTLFGYAIKLTLNQKRVFFESLQVFLQTQKEFLGEERVSQFHTRFLIELGRVNYLKIAPSSPVSSNKVRQPYRVKQRLNKRFLLLRKMKGG